MKKQAQLYEGKAKKVFATDDPDLVIVDYKDDATAFNGAKKGTITGKGVINNKLTNYLMQVLEREGIPTHFVEELSDRETLVKKVSIVPLSAIVPQAISLPATEWRKVSCFPSPRLNSPTSATLWMTRC